jgi:hypothetical protein
MRQSPERSFDFGDDATSPTVAKRQRYHSDINGTPQQNPYAAGASLHQPVRTPETMSSGFPPSSSFNASAGPFSSSFDFQKQMSTPIPYDSAPSASSGAHGQLYGQMPPGYGYSSRNIFDAPHQPHSLTEYTASGIQQGMRDDQEAAASSLQSLSVQPHSGNMSGHSAHIPENEFSSYSGVAVTDSNFDPTLTGISRPKGRYQERVDNHMQQLKSTKEEDSLGQQYQNAPYYGESSHLQVQPQHDHAESL